MIDNRVDVGGLGGRAGSTTVALLTEGVRVEIMRAMAGGFEALTLGQREISPEIEDDSPEVEDVDELEYTLGVVGQQTLPVASAIEYWLMRAPEGGLAYSDGEAQVAVEALAEAWGCGLIQTLVFGQQTASALTRALAGPSRRRVKRLLKKMRRVGMLELHEREVGALAYAPTEWLCRGMAPLVLGARLERGNPHEGALPIEAIDVETGLQLVTPLVRLREGPSGAIRLRVELDGSGRVAPAGVTATVEEGEVVACERGLDPEAPDEASGGIRAWCRALVDGSSNRLDYSGANPRRARALVEGLSEALF